MTNKNTSLLVTAKGTNRSEHFFVKFTWSDNTEAALVF